MKKTILLLVTALLLCLCSPALAADKLEFYNPDTGALEVRKDYYVTYTVLPDNTIRLDDVYTRDETATRAQLPSRVNGKDVTAINGESIFVCYRNYACYVIPPGITRIVNDEGVGLGGAVLFGDSVTSVEILGEDAPFFMSEDGQFFLDNTLVGCLGAKDRMMVDVAEGTDAVELSAFCQFEKLTSITLPRSVTEVHYAPDPGHMTTLPESLQRINVAHGNPVLRGVSGVLYAGDRLICCPQSALLTRLVPPAGVREIDRYALYGCVQLNEIQLPDSLEVIRYGAFYRTAHLMSLHLPAGVHTIEEGAFSNCYWLEQVTVAAENPHYRVESQLLVRNADNKALLAFGGEETRYDVPDTIRSLGDFAFSGRYYLKHVTLPEGLESLGNEVFSGTGLQTVTLPSTLKEMGVGVFAYCDNLTEVTFTGNGTALTCLPEKTFTFCEKLRQFTLPEGNRITSIGESAFSYCSQLQELTLPEGLTEIGDDAFWSCTRLKSLVLPASLPTFDVGNVYGCSQLKQLFVLGENTRLEGYLSGHSTTIICQNWYNVRGIRTDFKYELYTDWLFLHGPMQVVLANDPRLQQILDAGGTMTCTFTRSYDEDSFTDPTGKKYTFGRKDTSTLQIQLTTADGQTVTREYPCSVSDGKLNMGGNHLAFTVLDLTTVRVESRQWVMILKGGAPQ